MADAAEAAKGLLRKKVAGIPVLYIAGVAVLVLAFVAYKMDAKAGDAGTDTTSDADGADTAGATPDADATAAALDPASYASLDSNGTVTVTQPDGSSQSTDVVVATNDTWEATGVTYLIAQGLATGGDAEQALSDYLNGAQLSFNAGALRDAVIKQYGLPPNPPTPGGTLAPIAKRQGNPPTTHTVQGSNDNTFTKLAQLYYGRTDGDTIDLLQAANVPLGNGGPWAPSTKVHIPAYSVPKYYTATKSVRTLAAIASKNGITQVQLTELNDGMKFPVAVGKKVRVH